jgi:hypothetical protein
MIGLNGNTLISSIGYQNALRIEQGGTREPIGGSEGTSREKRDAASSDEPVPARYHPRRPRLASELAMSVHSNLGKRMAGEGDPEGDMSNITAVAKQFFEACETG